MIKQEFVYVCWVKTLVLLGDYSISSCCSKDPECFLLWSRTRGNTSRTHRCQLSWKARLETDASSCSQLLWLVTSEAYWNIIDSSPSRTTVFKWGIHTYSVVPFLSWTTQLWFDDFWCHTPDGLTFLPRDLHFVAPFLASQSFSNPNLL